MVTAARTAAMLDGLEQIYRMPTVLPARSRLVSAEEKLLKQVVQNLDNLSGESGKRVTANFNQHFSEMPIVPRLRMGQVCETQFIALSIACFDRWSGGKNGKGISSLTTMPISNPAHRLSPEPIPDNIDYQE